MNKDDILAKSRAENAAAYMDERERGLRLREDSFALGCGLLLALIGYPDWQRWYDGERSLTLTIAALVTKISCIFCVALPIALQLRKR